MKDFINWYVVGFLIFIILVEFFGYLIFKKIKGKKQGYEKINIPLWLFSHANETTIVIVSTIISSVFILAHPNLQNMEEGLKSTETIVSLSVALFFFFVILINKHIDYSMQNFYSNEVLGHIKVFLDTNQRIVNRKISSFDDPVIHKAGYLKVSNLINNYKNFENGEIPILNLDHFLEIWGIIIDTQPSEVKVIEYVPSVVHWDEYDDVEPFYKGLQTLSLVNNVKIERTVFTQDQNVWDEDFASHLFSQIADTSAFKINIAVSAKHTGRIFILINYQNKKFYEINYHEPLAIIGSDPYEKAADDKFVKSENPKSSISQYMDTSPQHPHNNVCRDNVFNAILDSDNFGDARDYYKLYSEVYKCWEENANAAKGDIYGVDTSMLSNDIQDWLNKAFYRRIIEDNGKFQNQLLKRGNNVKRIFILSDKMRAAKIPIVKKILMSHVNKGLSIGVIDIKWLSYFLNKNLIEQTIFNDLRDFNLIPQYETNGIAFEICGLRRKHENNYDFKKFYFDQASFPLSHPYWCKYESDNENYKKILAQWTNLSKCTIWFSNIENDVESMEFNIKSNIVECYNLLLETNRSNSFDRLSANKIKLEKLLKIIAIEEPSFISQKQFFEKGHNNGTKTQDIASGVNKNS